MFHDDEYVNIETSEKKQTLLNIYWDEVWFHKHSQPGLSVYVYQLD